MIFEDKLLGGRLELREVDGYVHAEKLGGFGYGMAPLAELRELLPPTKPVEVFRFEKLDEFYARGPKFVGVDETHPLLREVDCGYDNPDQLYDRNTIWFLVDLARSLAYQRNALKEELAAQLERARVAEEKGREAERRRIEEKVAHRVAVREPEHNEERLRDALIGVLRGTGTTEGGWEKHDYSQSDGGFYAHRLNDVESALSGVPAGRLHDVAVRLLGEVRREQGGFGTMTKFGNVPVGLLSEVQAALLDTHNLAEFEARGGDPWAAQEIRELDRANKNLADALLKERAGRREDWEDFRRATAISDKVLTAQAGYLNDVQADLKAVERLVKAAQEAGLRGRWLTDGYLGRGGREWAVSEEVAMELAYAAAVAREVAK